MTIYQGRIWTERHSDRKRARGKIDMKRRREKKRRKAQKGHEQGEAFKNQMKHQCISFDILV